jgi:hypothetical protein
MKKQVRCKRTFFPPKALREGFAALEAYLQVNLHVDGELGEEDPALKIRLSTLRIT